jgi:uncharacterized protein
MSGILNTLVEACGDGQMVEVRIGIHWTAAVVDVDGRRSCGLASTVQGEHVHGAEPEVPQAGELEALPAREVAGWVLLDRPLLASIGMATLNALLPDMPVKDGERNAEQLLCQVGAGKRVAMVGHFPFTARLRQHVAELNILELAPRPGDLPAEAAADVLPQAEVIAITGMSLVNHTLEGLLALCHPAATVMLLGPSSPLCPVLFDFGIDLISGSKVIHIERVVRAVTQGANFRQLHRSGLQLVTLARQADFNPA